MVNFPIKLPSLFNQTKNKIIAENVEVAYSILKKIRGLMFKKEFKGNVAFIMVFNKQGKYSIHTFFMRFPIDILFINNNVVVDLVENLKPWRYYSPAKDCKIIVELPEGTIKKTNTELNDIVILK